MQIFQRENSDFDNKFMPKFSYIAKRIIFVFVFLTGLCCVALRFSGMDWFDAVNHSFTSVSTGGFSTKNAACMTYPTPNNWDTLIAYIDENNVCKYRTGPGTVGSATSSGSPSKGVPSCP